MLEAGVWSEPKALGLGLYSLALPALIVLARKVLLARVSA